MRFFRIYRSTYAALDSMGAFINGGRWTSPGRHAIYCGTNVSVCRLEVESYLLTPLPPVYHVAMLEADESKLQTSLALDELPKGWDSLDARGTYSKTRPIGDEWLTSHKSLLLRVPSAISPLDYNIIINPEHGDFTKLVKRGTLPVSWEDGLKSKLYS